MLLRATMVLAIGAAKVYNSPAGVGHAIGAKSGGVIGYSTRNKKCATCDVAERSDREPALHDCRLNWSKSAKAMEPDIAFELAKEAPNAGIWIATVIGDEDSSTINKLCEEVDGDIVKWSDITHAKRSVESRLYEIKKHNCIDSDLHTSVHNFRCIAEHICIRIAKLI